MQYRPEIDGLRAVAVVPVILFHAGLAPFAGGYVGVDVFFVVSGYLITTIIAAELDDGRFSILGFYERRMRRILPALYAVMLALCAYGLLVMAPHEARDLAQSTIATTLFAENFLLLAERADYFALDTDLKPLMHAWSLGVEEQYYLLVPFALLLLWRHWRSRAVAVIALTFVASLALAVWAAHAHPSAAFYLLPTRGWELALGALVAMRLRYGHAGGMAATGQWHSLAGLALIVASVFLYDERTPFPGLYALAPTLGTALVILYAGQGTFVCRVLSWAPLVAIGLASYSAYLWHQPILAIMRAEGAAPDGAGPFALFLALTALAAALSYFAIELPFRRRRVPVRVQRWTFLAVSAGLLGFGISGYASNGFEAWKLARIAPERQPMYIDRLAHDQARLAASERAREAQPTAIAAARHVIIGDSTGDDLHIAFHDIGVQAWMQKVDGSCLPGLLDGEPVCRTSLDALLAQLGPGQVVWLAWNYASEGTQADIVELHGRVEATGADAKVVGGFLFEDISIGSFRYMRADRPMMAINADYFTRRDWRMERNRQVRAAVGEDDYIDKAGYFCGARARACTMYLAPDTPLFFDQLHLTRAGHRYFGEALLANEPALAEPRR